ncbi:ribose 5-phosphate isomerase [Candidatus Riesia sp. GBBU]|nr:ribose 5-phosphate isomerase [Candidatus Riesia sp. GBBU]
MTSKLDKLKKEVALEALKYISNEMIIGIGTGSTISYFIEILPRKLSYIRGVVSSSVSSTKKLKSRNINILDSNRVEKIDLYVDGVDEFNSNMIMIKGKGAALTREKVLAYMSKKFIVIADESKLVQTLGKSCLPVEVIPMACSYVSKELKKIGGNPKYRRNVITDNGNIILDVYNLKISNPIELENKINLISGVVEVGLFANKTADIILLSNSNGIEKITKRKHDDYM